MLKLRKVFLYAVLLIGGASQASGVEIEYDQQRAPRYPRSLYDKGISGLVVVEFNAHYDGSITGVRVVDSSHAKFTKAVEQAISKWRTKRWEPGSDAPETLPVRQHLYFTSPKSGRDVNGWVRRYIRELSCKKFNKALAAFQSNSPERVLPDMHVFTYTFKVLARSATRQKMTDEQRAAIGDDFVRAMPEVVELCAQQPALRYRHSLPDNIGRLL